jgi:hypothetical protein
MLDATPNDRQQLDEERLFGWHAALIPLGRGGMVKIDVACCNSLGFTGMNLIQLSAQPVVLILGSMYNAVHAYVFIGTPVRYFLSSSSLIRLGISVLSIKPVNCSAPGPQAITGTITPVCPPVENSPFTIPD